MSEETKAVEATAEPEDEQGMYERIYADLTKAIGAVIAAHVDGKPMGVYLPALDSLGANVVSIIMMLPEEVRENSLMVFARRTSTFYSEAARLEKAPMGTASRIITLN